MVELLVYTVLSLSILSSVFGVLITQSRQFGSYREAMEVGETLRGAAALLAAEIRAASPTGGDLYSIAPQSFTVRSIDGAGVVCEIAASQPKYGIALSSGAFEAPTPDSVLMFSRSNDQWNSIGVAQVWSDAVAGGVPSCAWAGGAPPDYVVAVTPGDTAGVGVGSGLKTYRRMEYGMTAWDGSWWLGRKVGAASTFELVTGPLRSPSDSGVAFHYYDASGSETANPTQVVRVELVLRALSSGKAHSSTGVTAGRDSITVTAWLRN